MPNQAELDVQEEWYFNASSRTLYFFPNRTLPNGTAPTPPTTDQTGKLAAVHLRNLVRVQGEGAGPTAVPGRSAGWKPAQNITFRGIGFRDAGWTVLDPHGAPSGGDWGMQSPQYPDTAGAIYLSGTEGVRFEGCTFKYLAVRTPLEAEPSLSIINRCDPTAVTDLSHVFVQGNGVYLAGYNRDASIVSSELTMIGDSPIALWGWTKSDDPLLPPGTVRQTVDLWLTQIAMLLTPPT